MSLLQDLREKFGKAQNRRLELETKLEENRAVLERRRELELELEAEELAAQVPQLLAEYRQIVVGIPLLYFDFEQSARELTQNLFTKSRRAIAKSRASLQTLYGQEGLGSHSIYTGQSRKVRELRGTAWEQVANLSEEIKPDWLPIDTYGGYGSNCTPEKALKTAWYKAEEVSQ